MKKLLAIAAIISVCIGGSAKAEGLLEASKNLLQKYGAPCVAGVAAGYVIDRNNGAKMGSIGCVMVFTYGEFGRGSNRTITTDDVAIIQEQINKSLQGSSSRIQTEYDLKLEALNKKIAEEANNNRQQIRNAVTDLGVFLDRDLNEKIDRKIENPALIKQIDQKISDAVKDEVQSELRSRERDIVNKAVEKTIQRVTAEPIVVDAPAKKETEPQQ